MNKCIRRVIGETGIPDVVRHTSNTERDENSLTLDMDAYDDLLRQLVIKIIGLARDEFVSTVIDGSIDTQNSNLAPISKEQALAYWNDFAPEACGAVNH